MDSSLQLVLRQEIVSAEKVSILVLMDSSLQLDGKLTLEEAHKGFNPCFNGFFSSIQMDMKEFETNAGFQSLF